MKARKEHKNFDKIDDKFLKKAGIVLFFSYKFRNKENQSKKKKN